MKSWVMALFWLSVWGGNQFTAQVNRFIAIPSAADIQFERAIANLPADWQSSPRTVILPGHDGVTGTLDDLIARCRQARIESVEIPGRETFLAAADRIQARSASAFPATRPGRQLLAGLQDPWGNPLRYDLIDSTHARISSAGPDRVANTQWDIGLIIEKTAAGPPASTSTWLGRRKAALGIREAPAVAGFARTEFSGGQSKLEGAAYFRFFTWLILGTAVLYIPFACLYRPKSYLHD